MSKTTNPVDVYRHHWHDHQSIRALVSAFRNNEKHITLPQYDPATGELSSQRNFNTSLPVMVIEGILLYDTKLLDDIFDRRVFIESDPAEANTRRVRRDKKREGENYIPEFGPQSFVAIFDTVYRNYVRDFRPQTKADLVIYN